MIWAPGTWDKWMTGYMKKYNKDKKIISNYHMNESEWLIWFISSPSKQILDWHTVGQKLKKPAFHMTVAFTLPEMKGLLKICCQPNWHTGSQLQTKQHWNIWNEGHARLNTYLIFFIVYLQPCLPLQIPCLETYVIFLP